MVQHTLTIDNIKYRECERPPFNHQYKRCMASVPFWNWSWDRMISNNYFNTILIDYSLDTQTCVTKCDTNVIQLQFWPVLVKICRILWTWLIQLFKLKSLVLLEWHWVNSFPWHSLGHCIQSLPRKVVDHGHFILNNIQNKLYKKIWKITV